MNQAVASKKKTAAKKEAPESERGRPKEIRVGEEAHINEVGQLILSARERITVHGRIILQTDTRVLRLPPGTLFLCSLDRLWLERGLRLLDPLILEEGRLSLDVASELPVLIGERVRLGVAQPLASYRLSLRKGETDERGKKD